MNAPNPGLAPFSCTYSPQVPELLTKLRLTLAITTYQAGKIVFLSPKDEEFLVQLPRTLEKPMGVALRDNGRRMAIACKQDVITFSDSPELARTYPNAPHRYDALYMPRTTYHVGALDIHDLEWSDQGLFGVNTLFSTLIKIDDEYNYKPYWQPPFISELASEDRCHLNWTYLGPTITETRFFIRIPVPLRVWPLQQVKPILLGSTACTRGDIDSDGDIDVLGAIQSYGYSTQFLYHENVGTATNPSFAASQADPFGLAGVATPGFLGLHMVDMDGDGDLDLMGIDAYTGSFYYILNGGSPTAPNFSQGQANPFGLTAVGTLELSTIGDLDMDGDLDILVGQYYGGFRFFENTGSASSPAFGAAQVNPFGLTNIGGYNFSALGDLDDDGDLDLLTSVYNYGSSNGLWYYFENDDPSIGLEEQEPNAAAYPNPFSDRIFVELGDAISGTVAVYDLTCKRVFQTAFDQQSQLRLDLSELTAGLYLLQIESEMGSKTLKITKQ